MQPTAIIIAIISGLASALLFAGIVLESSSAVSLALAAPIPIAIASLGWGSTAGFISAAVATAAIYAIAQSVPSALTLLGSMALPTAVAGHLAGLARPAAEDTPRPLGPAGANPPLDWYPLPRVFMAITLMAIASCIFLGWYLGFDPEDFVPAVVEALQQSGGAMDAATDVERRAIAELIIGLVPFVQPAVLSIALIVGLYLGAAIVRVSGRLPRPKDDIPTSAQLPQISLVVFAVAAGAAFIDGTIGLVADVFLGGFAAAFTLVGLAALHRRTRGRQGRFLVLFSSYAALLLLSFPILLFLAMGVYETWRRPYGPAPASRN
ncbi:hypothetical protein VQ042_10660 [Aurantimonas sp. A2-1-M11]|uniref:hypothetical protein n=1 Tax=Aurantimonas sp. A2-1-M11 TaxID=3113712 RepID=UPI002F95DAAB